MDGDEAKSNTKTPAAEEQANDLSVRSDGDLTRVSFALCGIAL